MINIMDRLVTAWSDLLDGVISVPVYKEDVPESEEGNYVLLRAESEANVSNKHVFGTQAVVITDIVTVFNLNVKRNIAEDIDGEIKALIRSTPGSNGLTVSGIQVVNVIPETSRFLTEEDGSKKYYRKIVRYNHLIIET